MNGPDLQRDSAPRPDEEVQRPRRTAPPDECDLLERVLQVTVAAEEAQRQIDAELRDRDPSRSIPGSSVGGRPTTEVTKPPHDLIVEGQGLVRSLAVRVLRSIPVRVDLDDLIGYGQVGLAEAARDFDPTLGTQFSSFAYYRVRGAIYDGLSKMTWTSRARYRRYRFEQIAKEALADDADEDAQGSGVPTADEASWDRGVTGRLPIVYLASQSGGDGGGDVDFADPYDSVATLVARQEIGERLHQLVDDLPRLEARLIRTVYFEGANLQQAAVRLSISKSWATRLHARALEKLARELRKLGGA